MAVAHNKGVCSIHVEILRQGAAPVTPCRHDSPAKSGGNKGDAAGRSADENGLNAPFSVRTGEDVGASGTLVFAAAGLQ